MVVAEAVGVASPRKSVWNKAEVGLKPYHLRGKQRTRSQKKTVKEESNWRESKDSGAWEAREEMVGP